MWVLNVHDSVQVLYCIDTELLKIIATFLECFNEKSVEVLIKRQLMKIATELQKCMTQTLFLISKGPKKQRGQERIAIYVLDHADI